MNKILRKFRHHPFGLKSYGFLSYAQLPKGEYKETALKNITGKNWCRTSDFPCANNHCGAVCAINIYSYLTDDYRNLEMYNTIYRWIGDGPIVRLSDYLKKIDHRLQVCRGLNDQKIKEEISKNHPVALLLGKAVNDFHWVMVVGIREYPDGKRYYRIVDGWNNSSLRYLAQDSKVLKVTMQSYCFSDKYK